MPTFTRFAILAATVAAANWVQLASAHLGGDDKNNHRRHLLEGEDGSCVLYKKVTEYSDPTREKDSWSCKMSSEVSRRFGGVVMMNVDGISKEFIESNHVISGEAVMIPQGAYIQQSITTDAVRMVVPKEAPVTIEHLSEDDPRHHRQRRNRGYDVPQIGPRTTLVVLVTDSAGQTHQDTVAEIGATFFTNAYSAKNHLAACSADQLILDPVNLGSGGVEEITIGIVAKTATVDDLEAATLSRANEVIGGNLVFLEQAEYDLVAFCWPSNDQMNAFGIAAFAYVNYWLSFFDNPHCNSVGIITHELGHNFGLGHSGMNGLAYGDETGVMGVGGPGVLPEAIEGQCFNPAKNYQLGWFNQALTPTSINPLDFSGSAKTYVLNGVDQYNKDVPSTKIINLRLNQFGDSLGLDYYIGYNHAFGSNIATAAFRNEVIIVSKAEGGPSSDGDSSLIGHLSVSETHTIGNFRGLGTDVYIRFDSISGTAGEDATITLTTSDTTPNVAPTVAPVAPTVAPVTPTVAPVAPTVAPVTPTVAPVTPTEIPTEFPTESTTEFEDFSCTDDADYRFKNKKKKTCAKWVARGLKNLNKKKKKKIKKKCKKRDGQQRVWDSCQETCALVGLGPCA